MQGVNKGQLLVDDSVQFESRFPIGLKIAAIYLILSGVIGLIWPLTGLGPHHPEFELKSIAYKLGTYFRMTIIELIFLISGIGILLRKAWARKLALTIIVIRLIYSTNEFAWGFAKGKPTLMVYLVSSAIVGCWSAIWFYLIFKRSSAEALSIKKT